MGRTGKRPISKTSSGSPEQPITRTESALDVTCHRCGREAKAREIEVELSTLGAGRNSCGPRIPGGWWLQGSFLLNPFHRRLSRLHGDAARCRRSGRGITDGPTPKGASDLVAAEEIAL
jgi:hypothetical protein